MAKSNNDFRVTSPGVIKSKAKAAAALKAAVAAQAQADDMPPSQPASLPLSDAELALSPEEFLRTYGFLRDGDVLPEPVASSALSQVEVLQLLGLNEADARHWAAWMDQHLGEDVPEELHRLLWGNPDDPQYRIR